MTNTSVETITESYTRSGFFTPVDPETPTSVWDVFGDKTDFSENTLESAVTITVKGG